MYMKSLILCLIAGILISPACGITVNCNFYTIIIRVGQTFQQFTLVKWLCYSWNLGKSPAEAQPEDGHLLPPSWILIDLFELYFVYFHIYFYIFLYYSYIKIKFISHRICNTSSLYKTLRIIAIKSEKVKSKNQVRQKIISRSFHRLFPVTGTWKTPAT